MSAYDVIGSGNAAINSIYRNSSSYGASILQGETDNKQNKEIQFTVCEMVMCITEKKIKPGKEIGSAGGGTSRWGVILDSGQGGLTRKFPSEKSPEGGK